MTALMQQRRPRPALTPLMLPGVVAYWPCTEGSGSTVNDITASTASGTVSGTGATLGPWNSPLGLNALGMRPSQSGVVSIPAASKLDLGDTFSFGVWLRRRALRAGTLFQRGATLFGAAGSELVQNPGFESAISTTSFIGNWKATNTAGAVTLDTVTKHGGTQAAKVAINSSNTNEGIAQGFYGLTAGRYILSYWGLDDSSNASGKHNLQVSYVPAAGGSTQFLQTNGTFSTTSADRLVGTHDSAWTQHTITFDLPELVTSAGGLGLQVVMKRQPGAGGGVAYNFWVDDVSLTKLANVAGGWAIDSDGTGVIALKAGGVTVASAPALTDHLGWHFVCVTKSGATTKVYIDGADVTVAGTNATIGASGSVVSTMLGGTDFGQLDCVAAHAFVVNRAITAAEVTTLQGYSRALPDKHPDAGGTLLKIGTNNYTHDKSATINFTTYAANLKALNITWTREAFLWFVAQPTNGAFTWTALDSLVNALVAQGIEIVPFFDSPPGWTTSGGNRVVPTDVTLVKGLSVASAGTSFATWRDRYITFMVACVNRYKDRIHTWEILNEYNGAIFSQPAASAPLYVNFYNTARAAILAEDPTATLIAASLCRLRGDAGTTDANSYLADEWLRAILDGGIGQMDYIGAHPYPENNSSPYAHNVNGVSLDYMHRLHDTLIEYGRTSTKILMNEAGFYTGATTIAAASGGASLPQATITVADATLVSASSGTFYTVNGAGAVQAIAYTGKTGTTFTGCTGGTGTLVTGNPVSIGNSPVTEAVQGTRLTDLIAVVRDYHTAFGDRVGIFSATPQSPTTDANGASSLWQDDAMTQPKAAVAVLAAAALPYKP